MDTYAPPIALAHPLIRLIGQCIDALVATMLAVFIFMLTVIVVEDLAFFLASATAVLYILCSDAFFNGQSLGKKWLNIRVVHIQTMESCSLLQSLLRNLTLPLGFFDWIFIFFGNRRRLGDFLASTIVVKV